MIERTARDSPALQGGWMRIFFAAVALYLLAAPANADLAEVKKRGELRVLVVETIPAFFLVQPKGDGGFDREILDGFCRTAHLDFHVLGLPSWGQLVPSLLEGKGDLIAGVVTASPARRRQLAFTQEVFPSRNVVVTRAPHKVVHTLEELRLEKVGTAARTTVGDLVQTLGIPRDNLDESLEPGKFTEALRSNKVGATVMGIEEVLLDRQKDSALQIGMFVGEPESLAYGLRKEDTELLKALDTYLQNFRQGGGWNRLVVKYFGGSALEVLQKTRKDAAAAN
jgi:membrane-bound lytic murein transglycosylase F